MPFTFDETEDDEMLTLSCQAEGNSKNRGLALSNAISDVLREYKSLDDLTVLTALAYAATSEVKVRGQSVEQKQTLVAFLHWEINFSEPE